MKKVIVFRVENVLVKDCDESVMYDRKKKNVMKKVLEMEGLKLEKKDWEGMKDELEVEEKEDVVMFGNEGDVEKMGEKEMKCVLGVGDMWSEIGLKKVGG